MLVQAIITAFNDGQVKIMYDDKERRKYKMWNETYEFIDHLSAPSM